MFPCSQSTMTQSTPVRASSLDTLAPGIICHRPWDCLPSAKATLSLLEACIVTRWCWCAATRMEVEESGNAGAGGALLLSMFTLCLEGEGGGSRRQQRSVVCNKRRCAVLPSGFKPKRDWTGSSNCFGDTVSLDWAIWVSYHGAGLPAGFCGSEHTIPTLGTCSDHSTRDSLHEEDSHTYAVFTPFRRQRPSYLLLRTHKLSALDTWLLLAFLLYMASSLHRDDTSCSYSLSIGSRLLRFSLPPWLSQR